jgi:DNA-binding XRE family transcriptional regulator
MKKLPNNKDRNEERRFPNYVRIHRRKVGLSQRELGRVLGYQDEFSISKHEQFHSTPTLVTALGYEIVFRVPVSEIFAGLKDQVEEDIEQRLVELELRLGQRGAGDRRAATIARKLEWLCERKNTESGIL